ncbi:MAG: MBL fold metallo-hydrolase [Chloroflexota bacterium]
MIHVEQHGAVIAIRMSRTVLGKPIYWTAAYWLDGLLIDTGPTCTAHELLKILQQVHVDQIAITHYHEDHTGGLAALRAHYPSIPIYVPWRTKELIEDPTKKPIQFYRRFIWGIPQPVANLQTFDDTDYILQTPDYRLRVIDTPGHTLDHVSFFEPHKRWLFCADAFIAGRDKSWSSEFNLFAIVSSLRTLAALRPERLFPGSGNVRRTPQPEIHEKIGYLIQLTREVAKLDALQMDTEKMISYLFEKESRMTFWTGGHFSAANLIEACREYNDIFMPNNHSEDGAAGTQQRNYAYRKNR